MMPEIITKIMELAQTNPIIAIILLLLSAGYIILWAETLFEAAGKDDRVGFYINLFTFPLPIFLLYKVFILNK